VQTITHQTQQVLTEFLQKAPMKQGALFVMGCSTSEILGKEIGRAGSLDVANALLDGLTPLREAGVCLAVQCCEHLNRALVMERQDAEKRGFTLVSAVPKPDAGGALAATIWQRLSDPVLVEHIRADAGMDIGGTLIGMHLSHVAVPVRLTLGQIGSANVICATTRPKLIGGERAKYD